MTLRLTLASQTCTAFAIVRCPQSRAHHCATCTLLSAHKSGMFVALQFGAPLREQLDLVTEAKHLEEFGTNFRHWSGVTFPQVRLWMGVHRAVGGDVNQSAPVQHDGSLQPRPHQQHMPAAPMRFSNAAQLCTSGCPPLLQPADAPLVSSEVLVETFEEGELISK